MSIVQLLSLSVLVFQLTLHAADMPTVRLEASPTTDLVLPRVGPLLTGFGEGKVRILNNSHYTLKLTIKPYRGDMQEMVMKPRSEKIVSVIAPASASIYYTRRWNFERTLSNCYLELTQDRVYPGLSCESRWTGFEIAQADLELSCTGKKGQDVYEAKVLSEKTAGSPIPRIEVKKNGKLEFQDTEVALIQEGKAFAHLFDGLISKLLLGFRVDYRALKAGDSLDGTLVYEKAKAHAAKWETREVPVTCRFREPR